MTVLTRWDPFREFSTLQDRMNRLFRDSYGDHEEALTTSTFAPAVDVYEDEHNVTLKNESELEFENDSEKEEKEENFRRVERQYGSFTRSFTLPNTVDTESIQANYDKGILKIQLAKKAEAKPKQIKVNVGSQKSIEGKSAGRAA